MHSWRPWILATALLFPAGCVDPDGHRITMMEWWQQRTSEKKHPVESEAVEDHSHPVDAEPPLAAENPNTAHNEISGSTTSPMGRNDHDAPIGQTIQADALIVNDETIRVSDILEPITPRLEQLMKELPPDSYFAKAMQIVRLQIIEAVAQHLIWRRAQRQLTDELKPQLDKAVDKMEKERINREFGGRETVYEKYLARHGKTRSDVRERLKRSLIIDSYLRDRLLQLIPMPRKSELEDYYKSHLAEFTQQERREMFLIDIPARAFLDPGRPMAPEDEAAAEQKARASAREAESAVRRGEDFQEVARKQSRGLHTDSGGDWGFITAPADQHSTPLEGRWAAASKRLFELKTGETSEIIESAHSFFIVKCGRIEGGHQLSFQEAQPKIAGSIRQQKFLEKRAAFLQDELDRSTIGSLDEFVSQVLRAAPSPDERPSKFEPIDQR